MAAQQRKSFYPLESNPEVFNELIQLLGVSSDLAFEDIYSLDDPELLPHPALALVLVLPEGPLIKAYAADAADPSYSNEYSGCGADEPVVWFKQTIYNACGLYALLHALSNGEASNHLERDGLLARLLSKSINLPPGERAQVLEQSGDLEKAHTTVALKGDSAVPESADARVLFHYICYVQSDKDGHVYELDGDRTGPVDTGIVLRDNEDVLSSKVLASVRKYVDDAEDKVNFSLMALVKRDGADSSA